MTGNLRQDCPICGGHQIAILQKPERRDCFVTNGPEVGVCIGVCACKICGFIFLNPRMSTSEMIDYYSRQSRMPRKKISEDSPLMQLMDIQINLIQRNHPIKDGASVLEVGCAEGYFLNCILEIKNNNVRIFGVEPSKRYANAAIKLIPSGKFYNDVMEKVHFGKEKFDLIILRHVLEHVQSPIVNLEIVSDILNKNGCVYIEVPDVSIPVETASHYFSHEHLSYFTLETLSATLARAGLKTIYADQFTANPKNSGFDYPVLRAIAVAGSKMPENNYPDQPSVIWDRHLRARERFFNDKLSPVLKRIENFSSHGKRLGIFGAGPHTMELLGKIQIPLTTWRVIFDNNPTKHGKRLRGIPIEKPTVDGLLGLDAILVSSNAFEGEIVAQLHEIAPKYLEILTIYQ